MKHTLLAIIIAAASQFTLTSAYANSLDIEQAGQQMQTATLTTISHNAQGYDKALAHYQLAVIAMVEGNGDSSAAQLEHAAKVLEPLTDVESKGLLAQVYGMQIGLSPLKGIALGGKASSLLDDALKQAPQNPRLYLYKGIAKFNTPAMFGGSKEEAEHAFKQAIAQFEQGQTGWGKAEAYTWLGLVKQSQKQPEQAKQLWQQAIEIAPEYKWPKHLLAEKS